MPRFDVGDGAAPSFDEDWDFSSLARRKCACQRSCSSFDSMAVSHLGHDARKPLDLQSLLESGDMLSMSLVSSLL